MEHGPEHGLEHRLETIEQQVSTGTLPGNERVGVLVDEAYAYALGARDGAVAAYIPALAGADPELFAVCVANVRGEVRACGDVGAAFSIQSISKAFVYALACEARGHDDVTDRVGMDGTGLPFDSVMALELHGGHPMNPMVNAGALATTALLAGTDPGAHWEVIHQGLSRFAGRSLAVDEDVYASESRTNQRNRALAHLLASYGRLDGDPESVVDVYTRQCSVLITAKDLAVMGATLADGGVNPITGEHVVSPLVCRDTLAVLATAGLYERSGSWLSDIGLPGKSGVSGGIVTIAPGKGAIGAFSPRLDEAGNSVRARVATTYLSRALGLNIFASAPVLL